MAQGSATCRAGDLAKLFLRPNASLAPQGVARTQLSKQLASSTYEKGRCRGPWKPGLVIFSPIFKRAQHSSHQVNVSTTGRPS